MFSNDIKNNINYEYDNISTQNYILMINEKKTIILITK